MMLDDRMRVAKDALDRVTAGAAADGGDLDRRRRRHVAGTVSLAAIGLAVAGLAAVAVVRNVDRDDATIATGAAPTAPTDATDATPAVAVAPAAVPVEPSVEPAYSLPTDLAGWELVAVTEIRPDLGVAFAGEDFSQLAVTFDVEPDPLTAREGTVTQTVRVGVGTYTDDLRAVYPGPGTPVTVGEREFELVEVAAPNFHQTALVPVDLTERTFVISGRGVDADTLVELAGSIDPTGDTPAVGTPPVGFTVIHSGAPEFPVLDAGTARTYRDPADGGRTVTVTTYSGPPISCFAYAWVHPDTDLTPIGGDTGVVAQVTGEPGLIGTYEALWNVDHGTLVGVTASGITRAELVDLAGRLVVDPTPSDAYLRPLPFAF